MADTTNLEVVTPTAIIVSEPVEMVVVPGSDGQIGALPRHSKVISTLDRGLVDIIIGTRSSVFLPMKDLGIIVVDEEHDLSFKQMDKFRYSARDMALYRAKLEKVPVVLASATPSLETLKNAQEDKYTVLKLSKRATGASLPTFQAVDLRGKELYEGLSKEILEASRSVV